MWHKDQKSCAFVLAIVKQALILGCVSDAFAGPLASSMEVDQYHDRFVLISLCWLYGRNEFPPPLLCQELSNGLQLRRTMLSKMHLFTPLCYQHLQPSGKCHIEDARHDVIAC